MDYSYLNQAGFDPSAMSSLQSAASAVVSEANFYSDLSGTCPSSAAAAAMMPSYYGTLGGRNHSSVMRSAYGPTGPVGGMPTPTGSPTSCGVIPRNTPEHHRQSMFGAAGMGLNCKYQTIFLCSIVSTLRKKYRKSGKNPDIMYSEINLTLFH